MGSPEHPDILGYSLAVTQGVMVLQRTQRG